MEADNPGKHIQVLFRKFISKETSSPVLKLINKFINIQNTAQLMDLCSPPGKNNNDSYTPTEAAPYNTPVSPCLMPKYCMMARMSHYHTQS